MAETTPTQYRLEPETLADLDYIAEWLAREQGVRPYRANAIRHAARQVAGQIRRREAGKKTSEKSPEQG